MNESAKHRQRELTVLQETRRQLQGEGESPLWRLREVTWSYHLGIHLSLYLRHQAELLFS